MLMRVLLRDELEFVYESAFAFVRRVPYIKVPADLLSFDSTRHQHMVIMKITHNANMFVPLVERQMCDCVHSPRPARVWG
jgi:hypothetical protein